MRHFICGLIAVVSFSARGQCPHESAENDARCTFEVKISLGLATDTFAAAEYASYVYAGAGGGSHERSFAGAEVAYRLLSARVGEHNDYFKRQLWVFAETVHGVRSADINCSTNPNLPTCAQALSTLTNPANLANTYLYLLRNATSLEGYAGFRYEFAHLNDFGGLDPDGTPANVYLQAQAGFLKVAGSPGGALNLDKIALGVIATQGNYAGSYLDAGFGRDDLFPLNPRRRVAIDAYLRRKLPPIAGRDRASLFAQMVVDADLGRGSDSFQTSLGVNLELSPQP